ncbi:MAG TPA: OB-fold domain-containing protein [Acidimicrobiia bacterium]|nr:OB-fold domain-containing protein [Acidimicrobiia bacterium]
MTVRSQGVIAPDVDADSGWWWEALSAGRLLLPRCDACAAWFFPPMATCPRCAGTAVRGVEAGGRGTVYSWVVVHVALDPSFAGDVPYTVVAVDLDEGPRLFGRLLGDRRPAAGAPVQAIVEVIGGTAVLGFTLV